MCVFCLLLLGCMILSLVLPRSSSRPYNLSPPSASAAGHPWREKGWQRRRPRAGTGSCSAQRVVTYSKVDACIRVYTCVYGSSEASCWGVSLYTSLPPRGTGPTVLVVCASSGLVKREFFCKR
ncbi:hypothetical protein LY76DRAFT_421016 [Colletotrichum caudatum]|nr:hypothetical protein LY76DRAFT_421016 [Colletotrichum caudatum]